MSNKIKNSKTSADRISEVAQQAGIVLMATAATLGMLEASDHSDRRIALPAKPVFAFANDNFGVDNQGNQLRREREEVADHFISYSVVERTPARSGKV